MFQFENKLQNSCALKTCYWVHCVVNITFPDDAHQNVK